jgi:hypothetical protein
VTSVSPADASSTKVSWVPQVAQKVRVACELDLKRVGTPESKTKSPLGTLNQATQGAPVVPRHISQ